MFSASLWIGEQVIVFKAVVITVGHGHLQK